MNKKIVIIGGGIGGLSLAWFLRDKNPILLEASSKCGGWIQKQGPFSIGPKTILTAKDSPLIKLLEGLGLSPLPFPDSIRKKYVLWRGKLHLVPNSFFSFLSSPLLKGIRRDLLKGFLWRSYKKEDQSVASFFRDRFSREVALRLGVPLTRGIFGSDGENLSFQGAFPHFGRKRNTILLEGGIHRLIEKLENDLGPIVLKETPVQKIVPFREGVEVHTPSGVIRGDWVISTLPLPQLAPLVPLDLSAVPHQSLTVLNVAWEKESLPFEGFGYLVSPTETGNLLGVIFDSFLEQIPSASLTLMFRGLVDPVEEGMEAVKRSFGIRSPPGSMRVTSIENGIPQYPVGYLSWKKKTVESLKIWAPRLVPLGTGFSGISVSDAVESGYECARSLKESFP